MLQIEEMLIRYKDALALLELNKARLHNIATEAVEELCLSAPILSDMPKSITNQFQSKTENAAINVSVLITMHRKIIQEQQYRISVVEGILKKLTTEEYRMVTQKYFEGKYWKEIAAENGMDKNTARKIVKYTILPKLQKLLEE